MLQTPEEMFLKVVSWLDAKDAYHLRRVNREVHGSGVEGRLCSLKNCPLNLHFGASPVVVEEPDHGKQQQLLDLFIEAAKMKCSCPPLMLAAHHARVYDGVPTAGQNTCARSQQLLAAIAEAHIWEPGATFAFCRHCSWAGFAEKDDPVLKCPHEPHNPEIEIPEPGVDGWG